MQKILYILSGNLSTTPRALQSILLSKQFYDVDIVAINRNKVWADIDIKLVAEHNLNYKLISLTRKPFIQWFLASIVNKLSLFLYKFTKTNIKISAYASTKVAYLLNKNLKNKNYYLVIGHSYGSIFPVYNFSQKNKIPFSFDIEDYHAGESINIDKDNEIARRELLMKTILPNAKYLTYASPLIGKYSIELIENKNLPNHFLVNNSFSQTDFEYFENNSEKVKFVWFSQNINQLRGLELVLPSLFKFKNQIEVTLFGNLNQYFYDNFLYLFKDFLRIEKPLIQKELHKKLCEFDIGLAIEISNTDTNKDIALSNKIFAYSQAGLFIIATDTQAQKLFISENKNLGIITKQNDDDFKNKIENIIQNITKLRKQKIERFEYSKKLSFENESLKLLEIWKNI